MNANNAPAPKTLTVAIYSLQQDLLALDSSDLLDGERALIMSVLGTIRCMAEAAADLTRPLRLAAEIGRMIGDVTDLERRVHAAPLTETEQDLLLRLRHNMDGFMGSTVRLAKPWPLPALPSPGS